MNIGLLTLSYTRACLKIAFCQLYATICGRFDPNEGDVVGYAERMRSKDAAKWGVQMAGMNFQTRSKFEKTSLSGFALCKAEHFTRKNARTAFFPLVWAACNKQAAFFNRLFFQSLVSPRPELPLPYRTRRNPSAPPS